MISIPFSRSLAHHWITAGRAILHYRQRPESIIALRVVGAAIEKLAIATLLLGKLALLTCGADDIDSVGQGGFTLRIFFAGQKTPKFSLFHYQAGPTGGTGTTPILFGHNFQLAI